MSIYVYRHQLIFRNVYYNISTDVIDVYEVSLSADIYYDISIEIFDVYELSFFS